MNITESFAGRSIIRTLIQVLLVGMSVFGAFAGVRAYPDVFDVDAQMVQRDQIGPYQPVSIVFTQPMLIGKTQQALQFEPSIPVAYSWADANRRLTIIPREPWSHDRIYLIRLRSAPSVALTRIDRELSFATATDPQVRSVIPASGERDVLLDIEDPVIFRFSRPLNNYRVSFTIEPYQELASQLNDERTEVSLLPQKPLERGQRYTIRVLVRHIDEPKEASRQISETWFETKPLPPTQWEKDFVLRLDQARRFTEAQIADGKYIDINLTSQILTIFENGRLLDAYMVSTGKRGMETPRGTFAVSNKTLRAWSKKYGLYMPYWMALVPSGDFGIHELPEWPGGYKEGAAHLGIPVSHGCVRLGIGPARRVYEWADLGTPIVVHR